MLGRLYPRGNSSVLIIQEVEWTPGPVWTRRSEEKSPPLRHPGSSPGRPAHSQAPCRLSHLTNNLEKYKCVLMILTFYLVVICCGSLFNQLQDKIEQSLHNNIKNTATSVLIFSDFSLATLATLHKTYGVFFQLVNFFNEFCKFSQSLQTNEDNIVKQNLQAFVIFSL